MTELSSTKFCTPSTIGNNTPLQRVMEGKKEKAIAKARSDREESSSPFGVLPGEIRLLIFTYLDTQSLLLCRLVEQSWVALLTLPQLYIICFGSLPREVRWTFRTLSSAFLAVAEEKQKRKGEKGNEKKSDSYVMNAYYDQVWKAAFRTRRTLAYNKPILGVKSMKTLLMAENWDKIALFRTLQGACHQIYDETTNFRKWHKSRSRCNEVQLMFAILYHINQHMERLITLFEKEGLQSIYSSGS